MIPIQILIDTDFDSNPSSSDINYGFNSGSRVSYHVCLILAYINTSYVNELVFEALCKMCICGTIYTENCVSQ